MTRTVRRADIALPVEVLHVVIELVGTGGPEDALLRSDATDVQHDRGALGHDPGERVRVRVDVTPVADVRDLTGAGDAFSVDFDLMAGGMDVTGIALATYQSTSTTPSVRSRISRTMVPVYSG